MASQNYNDLYSHKEHKISIHTYYDENVAIECEDCHEVLLDFDRSQNVARDMDHTNIY